VTNATFSSATISGSTLTLALANVVNKKYSAITLAGLSDLAGNTLTGTATLTVGNLYGDVNGTATVNSTDIAIIKSKSGVAVTATSYLYDITASGAINSTDIAVVKSLSGSVLS